MGVASRDRVARPATDVDSASATVSIGRGIVEGPDGLVEKGTKTYSARRVSLDSRTAAELEEHWDPFSVRCVSMRRTHRSDSACRLFRVVEPSRS